jgi:Dyp-type peroxidase family
VEKLELEDIQGLLARGYGRLRAARFLLLSFMEPGLAGPWLRGLAGKITHAGEDPRTNALHVAFTPDGFRALALPEDAIAGFSNEFREGMTTRHRQRILGDTGTSAPASWLWGGPDTPAIHGVLMLYAVDEPTLATLVGAQVPALADAKVSIVATLDTCDLGGNEHFGFHDGISQPVIDGIGRDGPAAQTVQAGEFVLGYLNEYGLLTDRPTIPADQDRAGILPGLAGSGRGKDLGRNGSYLVVRQMEQRVSRFWRSLDQLTRHDDTPDPEARVRLAAKMVGRWPGGAPLTLSPDADDPSQASMNDFGYHEQDADGLRCPIGAHIRRTNPRDSLDPNPGSEGSIRLNRRHRILRRGRAYGTRLTMDEALQGEASDGGRGLHFVCLVGNIQRQFEFIQHTWANNPKFAGLYEEVDPLVGPRGADGATFAMPVSPVRARVQGLPEYVTVRGGAYFFMPGIRAVRYLASLSS